MNNTEPTEFAKSLHYVEKSIYDLGCGNGRDTYYFSKGNLVLGIDPKSPQGILFTQQDAISFLKERPEVDVIYCRFLFHIIDENTEDFVIAWAGKNAKELAIEVRAEGDVPLVFPTSHHQRRFANPGKLIKKIQDAGFKQMYIQLGYGLAIFETEDPYILRIIAKK